MTYKNGPSLRSLLSRQFLAFLLTLAGGAALLAPRLRHPFVQDLLAPFKAPAPPPEALCPALLERQFQVDILAASLALAGFFLIFYYRRRLAPALKRLEDLGLDR